MLARSRFSRALAAVVLAGGVAVVSACAGGGGTRNEEHAGYSGKKWEDDFGVLEGHCNRQAVGAALGGLIGGVIGSQVGDGNDRKIAIAIGSVAGAFIGSRIGRDMDQADRACVGHALELAGDQSRVTWTGADGKTTYRLTPVRGFEQNGVTCREFDLGVNSAERQETRRAKACPAGDGNWRIVG